MYIDGDTHYWPLRFIDKVSHPGKGYVEVHQTRRPHSFRELVPKGGDLLPGRQEDPLFQRGSLESGPAGRIHEEGRFDVQVLIPTTGC